MRRNRGKVKPGRFRGLGGDQGRDGKEGSGLQVSHSTSTSLSFAEKDVRAEDIPGPAGSAGVGINDCDQSIKMQLLNIGPGDWANNAQICGFTLHDAQVPWALHPPGFLFFLFLFLAAQHSK